MNFVAFNFLFDAEFVPQFLEFACIFYHFYFELLRQRLFKYVEMIILVFPHQDTLHSDDDH